MHHNHNVPKEANRTFTYHLLMGMLARLLLILYGSFHDEYLEVPYTDVDYKVFTDAARHVAAGRSPYQRHTYRYSPILAYLMIPNLLLHNNFGKLLFSLFDGLVAIAVKLLVQHQLENKNKDKELVSRIAVYSSLLWLYNPFSIAISTRGNADSVSCFLIIVSLLFLQTNIVESLWKYALSGFFLGISIHLRLYPLAFSFPMYLSLGKYKINRRTSVRDGLLSLLPNKRQLILTISCVLTLTLLTLGMYFLYGYEFLFETYIYHLFRKDVRHNFSVLFYYSYLTMGQLALDLVKTVTLVVECAVLFVISLALGHKAATLPLALFCQSMVLVAFNSVVTSQYFVWYLSLLPLVAHSLRASPRAAGALALLWAAPQAAWLYVAYLLEFKSIDVFIYIWAYGVLFFNANILILDQIIKRYRPNFGFGLTSESLKKKPDQVQLVLPHKRFRKDTPETSPVQDRPARNRRHTPQNRPQTGSAFYKKLQ